MDLCRAYKTNIGDLSYLTAKNNVVIGFHIFSFLKGESHANMRNEKYPVDYLRKGHVTPIDTSSAKPLVGGDGNASAGIKKSDGNGAGFG